VAPRAALWDADGVLQHGVPSWPGVFADVVGNDVDTFAAAVWADLDAALAGDLDMAAHVEQVIAEQGLSGRRAAINLESPGSPGHPATARDSLGL